MITGAAMKRDLEHALSVTPDVRSKTIATQRAQLTDQMTIAANAWDGDDFELLESALGHALAVVKALRENLELDTMSRCTVTEAPEDVLAKELLKRANAGDPDARKAILDAARKLKSPPKKGKPNGARV